MPPVSLRRTNRLGAPNPPRCGEAATFAERSISGNFVQTEVTQTDGYPMPNPHDLLDRFHGDRYFTKLDCASAYWAIEIREEDRHKTAFVCPRGLFEMIRMPFGLVNNLSSYQRANGQHFEKRRSRRTVYR